LFFKLDFKLYLDSSASITYTNSYFLRRISISISRQDLPTGGDLHVRLQKLPINDDKNAGHLIKLSRKLNYDEGILYRPRKFLWRSRSSELNQVPQPTNHKRPVQSSSKSCRTWTTSKILSSSTSIVPIDRYTHPQHDGLPHTHLAHSLTRSATLLCRLPPHPRTLNLLLEIPSRRSSHKLFRQPIQGKG